MAGRIILHVGAPKTGSTYLQTRMRAGADMLRRAGLYVPVLPEVARIAGNAKLLAVALSGAPSSSFARRFPAIDTRALDPAAVIRDLTAHWRRDEEDIVLSAENFRARHAARLRALLPADAPCHVVLVVRPQDDWIESYWGQLLKTGDIACDLAAFVTEVCTRDAERLPRPDWADQHAAWAGAFDACSVLLYDEAKADLFGAFLGAAGLAGLPPPPEVPRAQVALDPTELVYLLRHAGAADLGLRRRAAAEAAARLTGLGACSMLDPAQRAWLIERFAASNAALLDAIGRGDAARHLSIRPVAGRFRSPDAVASSPESARHAALADRIYADLRAGRPLASSRQSS